jgi:hypothetical protein
VKLFGHRQTKEAATDKPNLLLPRHISTLPVCDLRDGCCARQQLLQASPVCPAVCDRVGGPSGNAPRVRKGKTTRWERSMPCRSRVSTALNLHGRPVAMSHETRQNRPGQDGGAGPGGSPGPVPGNEPQSRGAAPRGPMRPHPLTESPRAFVARSGAPMRGVVAAGGCANHYAAHQTLPRPQRVPAWVLIRFIDAAYRAQTLVR